MFNFNWDYMYRAVILAGGLGTRLLPLTQIWNKHILPIYNRPMIFYPLQSIYNAGIRSAIVVLGGAKTDQVREMVILIRDQYFNDLMIEFVNQGDPRGLGDGLLCAERFLKNSKFLMMLGDNITLFSLKKLLEKAEKENLDCCLAIKPVDRPFDFGVAEIKEGKVVNVEEKPTTPKSNLAVTGIYLFSPKIFDILRKTEISARNELEITDGIQNMINQNYKVGYEILDDWWLDAGTFDSLLDSANYMKENSKLE
ncbi:MAG: sugar nucleotidyltransferase [Candidatus Heimdallarchaeota archaeon]|nr:sugar nucleotidyltransferase [Candidatus Heimdallarchaeota archaeon]